MAEKSQKGFKTLWDMEKLLVTSNFSFSLSVFNSFILWTCKKTGLVWERVKRPPERSPLEILWIKEKMLLTSIFSFFHNFSTRYLYPVLSFKKVHSLLYPITPVLVINPVLCRLC